MCLLCCSPTLKSVHRIHFKPGRGTAGKLSKCSVEFEVSKMRGELIFRDFFWLSEASESLVDITCAGFLGTTPQAPSRFSYGVHKIIRKLGLWS